jgi:hypothetical protein
LSTNASLPELEAIVREFAGVEGGMLPALHAVQHHAMIVHVLSVQRQIVREMTVHVLIHHAAKNQHLKRLSLTSAKSQKLAQLSLSQSAQHVLIAIQHQFVIQTRFHQLVAMQLRPAQLAATMVARILNHASAKNMFRVLASAAKTQLVI